MTPEELRNFIGGLAGATPTPKPKTKARRKKPSGASDAKIKPTPINAWDRQPRETDRAFAAFSHYRALPPDATKLKQTVAEKIGHRNVRQIDEWCAQFKWIERRTAYMAHIQQTVDNALTTEIVKSAKATAQRQGRDYATWHIRNVERAAGIADTLFTKAEEILNLPVASKTVRKDPVFDAAGNQLIDGKGNLVFTTVTTLKPTRFSVSDAPRFVEAAIILGQYAAEQQAFIERGGVDKDLPVADKPLTEMTPDELDDYIIKMRQAKEAVIRGEPIEITATVS